MSSVNEVAGRFLISKMAALDDEERLKMLEGVDAMHVSAFVAWLGMEIPDHEDCSAHCPFKNPEGMVEGYLEQFSISIRRSMKATCEANGVQYAPDPNKEVRDEILSQDNT